MKLFCCGCQGEVEAELVTGKQIYPHRKDLHDRPFWQCPECWNYVGCHYKTANPTAPLGVISTPELRQLRMQIHSVMDPLWQRGRMTRRKIYAELSRALGWQYHTAKIKSVDEARKVLNQVTSMAARYDFKEAT